MNKQIVIKPVITEKSLKDASNGTYTFEVDLKADKNQIKSAVEKIFTVHVKDITIVIIKGKNKIAGRKRRKVKQSDIKKARVKLATGEQIDLFEIGEGK
jgi:large subunit ribosomal protein L23